MSQRSKASAVDLDGTGLIQFLTDGRGRGAIAPMSEEALDGATLKTISFTDVGSKYWLEMMTPKGMKVFEQEEGKIETDRSRYAFGSTALGDNIVAFAKADPSSRTG